MIVVHVANKAPGDAFVAIDYGGQAYWIDPNDFDSKFAFSLLEDLIALAESGYHNPVNIGNPEEFTLLELAKTVIEVTGSRSEIVYEALPVDDPQVRQPDITLAREILGWEPEISLREGLERTIEQAGAEALIGAGR